MKKVFYAITNFLKIILLSIINFFLSLFPDRNKESIKVNKEKINIIKTKTNPVYYESSTALPDEDSNKSFTYKETTPDITKTLYREDQLILISLIEEVIDKTIEKKENIEIKRIDNDTKEKITELKKKITPVIIKEISNDTIDNKDKLKDTVKLTIEIEFKKKPLFDTPEQKEELQNKINNEIKEETIKKEEQKNKEQTNNKEVKQEEKPKQTIKEESKQNEFKEEPKDITPSYEPIHPIQPHIELKDEVTNIITASTLVLANITREVLFADNKIKEKEKTLTKTKKENRIPNQVPKETPKKEATTPSINIQTINIDIPPIKEEQVELDYVFIPKGIAKEDTPIKENKINQENKDIKPKPEEEITTIKKENIKVNVINNNIIVEETKEEIQTTKDKINKEEKTNKPLINLAPIQKGTKQMIEITSNETKKESLEDKNYEALEQEIDIMLNQITNFMIKYEDKLTPEQKAQLDKELDNLRSTKNKMLNQKEKDIKAEEYHLNQYIVDEELKGLKKELKKADIEHQNDLNEAKLKQVEDLNNMYQKEADIIEKKLIKKKLRRASKTAAITSLIALPFVNNIYFFYFSIGAIVTHQFTFIDSLIHRKTKEKELNLPELKKGQDALYEAINSTNNNIEYLEHLEYQILHKYPELQHDNEYLLYINQLKDKLYKTANKLHKKQEILEKYCHKDLRYKKVLKKEDKK